MYETKIHQNSCIKNFIVTKIGCFNIYYWSNNKLKLNQIITSFSKMYLWFSLFSLTHIKQNKLKTTISESSVTRNPLLISSHNGRKFGFYLLELSNILKKYLMPSYQIQANILLSEFCVLFLSNNFLLFCKRLFELYIPMNKSIINTIVYLFLLRITKHFILMYIINSSYLFIKYISNGTPSWLKNS
jgi:hypothetical protein